MRVSRGVGRYPSGNLKCEIVLKITIMCTEDRNKSLICVKSDKKFKSKQQVGWEFERSYELGSVQVLRDEEKVHLKSQEF